MKFHLHVNQGKALSLGINNINQAIILDLLCSASTWAQAEIFEGEVYYWVARQKVCSELKILGLKPDTVYRHLKSLCKLGLIDYKKSGKKDIVKLTELGMSYYVGNESEQPRKQIRESSEMNPTDPITKDPSTIDKAKTKRFTPPPLQEVINYCQERGNHVDARQFVDFYESKGWKVGSSQMKDWRAAVRTWEYRDKNNKPQINSNSTDWANNMDEVF